MTLALGNLLIAHSSVGKTIATLLRADALKIVRECLRAVHLVVSPLVEHHISRASTRVVTYGHCKAIAALSRSIGC